MRKEVLAMPIIALVVPFYLLIIVPYGIASRSLFDPLRLRFRKTQGSYFRLAQVGRALG